MSMRGWHAEAMGCPREDDVDGLYMSLRVPVGRAPEDCPTILFMHGAFHGAWVWADWQQRFAAAGWTAAALSVRNHPGSYRLSDQDYLRLDPEDYIDDLCRAADSLARPVVLCGHSMGGLIAQKAAERLDALAGLVVLASAPPQGIGASRKWDYPDDAPIHPHYEQVRRHLFANDIETGAYDDFFVRLVPETPGVINRTGRGKVSVDPARITVPFLAVDGEIDRNRYAPRLADRYGGEYVTVPRAGHNLMCGRWGPMTAEVVIRWLESRLDDYAAALRPTWTHPKPGPGGDSP